MPAHFRPRARSLPDIRVTPRPHSHRWGLEGCKVCLHGQGTGSRVWDPGSRPSPPLCAEASSLLALGQVPHPGWRPGHGGPASPPGPAPTCPSHWVCFLSRQFSSRDSPVTRHTLSWVGAAASRPPQEGDTRCPLLLKTQTKAQSAPPPGPGRPARGSGEPGPGCVCPRFPDLFICSAPQAQGEPLGLLTADPE